MAVWLALILAAYLLGSLPVSLWLARLSRGIDLRQYGTGQVGAGNLWRMTSWRLALPAGIFDLSKGLVMVWVAHLTGLNILQQMTVGVAAIIGHNWSVFLRFDGGRGVGTSMGVIFILLVLNEVTPWPAVSFFTVLVIGAVMLRSSALPILLGMALVPLVSSFFEPLSLTLGYLAIFLILVVKRLTAPRRSGAVPVSKWQLLLYRLFFDRDIKDRKSWMYRVPTEAGATDKPEEKSTQ